MEIEKNIPLPKYNWYNSNNKYEDVAKKNGCWRFCFF